MRKSFVISSSSSSVGRPYRCGAGWRALREKTRVGRESRETSGSRCPRRRDYVSRVNALDAAQPFDYEGRMQARIAKERQLKIGVVGFGTFGQFLADRLVQQGHLVTATSRRPYDIQARKLGVHYFQDVNDFCEDHPDVVVFSTSIISLETVLSKFPTQRLRRSTLVVDVASVKVFPKQAMLRLLPPELDILCTHPMFGPDSGKHSWKGLKFMYEPVRVNPGDRRQKRLELFLKCFESAGCEMVNMTCEEHDRMAAGTQFITHTVGRILGAMELEQTNIDTKGFESLRNLVENTTNDSFDLYYGLFMYNQNAPEELAKLERAFEDVKTGLFDRLHSKVREQLFPGVSPTELKNELRRLPQNATGGGGGGGMNSSQGGLLSAGGVEGGENSGDSENVQETGSRDLNQENNGNGILSDVQGNAQKTGR
ncbi:hypothetical protein BSKO_12502 [Bryopsis sp. KO-2023]|nr:hypothetical protein BSKO_12502 [Bryopsis sp. KO-2023]